MNRFMVFIALLCLVLTSGCAGPVFVSERDGHLQIYKMRETGASQTNISNNNFSDSFPDVSPDDKKIVFTSIRGGQHTIYTRDIEDTDGSTELQLISVPFTLTCPRRSPQQDLIAFAEYTSSNQAKIFTIRSDGTGTPGQITNPTGSESDSGGHDFFEYGNKIVFSRRNSDTNTYDLFYKNSDGTGSPLPIRVTTSSNETLPVVSHNGKLLAYREYVMLASGWIERIQILHVENWTPFATIVMQSPVRIGSIEAIAFSRDNQRLYVAAESTDVSGSSAKDKIEIFSLKLDGTDQKRLTENQVRDSYPSCCIWWPLW